MKFAFVRLLLRLSCLAAFFVAIPLSAADVANQLRRPVALDVSADGRWLYVANRDSGSLSVIDIGSQQVVREHAIGRRLSEVKCLAGAGKLLIADEAAHELILARSSGAEIEVMQRLPISPYPVSVEVAADGREATVA